MHNPFRYFKTSPEIIRLAVMLYIRFRKKRGHVPIFRSIQHPLAP
ncbi:hypothetical protein [Marinobacter sp.]|nr:hypothetical protein [Marinobacter sp.]